MGIRADTVRAGQANMFLSPLFGAIFATVTGARWSCTTPTGPQGAARGAGLGAGVYPDAAAAFRGLRAVRRIEPEAGLQAAYAGLYGRWREALERRLAAGSGPGGPDAKH